MVLCVVEPDPGHRPAAVVLPLAKTLRNRRIGDVLTVRRIRSFDGVRDRKLDGVSALNRHRVELAVAIGVDAARELKRTADPSAVKSRAMSAPGCQVSRRGSPPVAGTT